MTRGKIKKIILKNLKDNWRLQASTCIMVRPGTEEMVIRCLWMTRAKTKKIILKNLKDNWRLQASTCIMIILSRMWRASLREE